MGVANALLDCVDAQCMTDPSLLINADSRQILCFSNMRFKVRKNAKIRNLYNQVPHLTQDTIFHNMEK